MIRILNARMGFATNSSSSHSIIILNRGDDLPPEEYPNYDDNFGWDNFTLTSPEQKSLYFAAILYQGLSYILPDRAAHILMKELVGERVADRFTEDDPPSIDHQSMYMLPYEFNKDFIDLEFAEEFNDYLQKREVVILGGNDNDDNDHPLYDVEKDPGFNCFKDVYCRPVCRKDKKYGYWVLFNQDKGTKVRFQFEGTPQENKPPKRAYAPELIDIKITDFCDKGCHYCYQGATSEGEHAEGVGEIAYNLSNLKIFEVALGGGEPTCHPDFANILENFREYGTVPNFTTRSLEWLCDAEIRESVKKNAGSFSFTVSSADEVRAAHRAFKRHKLNGMAQYNIVMGTVEERTFRLIVQAIRRIFATVVLLGFKPVGRGKNFEMIDYDWLPSVLEELEEKGNLPRVSIDTVLASEYAEEWASIGVSPYTLEMVDGSYSCYIDAVNKKIGPSSYCEENEMIDLPSWYGLEMENALEDAMDRFEKYTARMRKKIQTKTSSRVQYLELD